MITVLSPQGEVRGAYINTVPEATPYFEDKFTDNLETMQTTLEFQVPLQSPDSEWLEGFGTVLYPDKDGNLRELTIINVFESWSQGQPTKRVVCEDSSVDALLKSHVVPFTAGNLNDALRGALLTTPWEYILGGDTIGIGYQLVDVKEYTDVRTVLENIRNLYDVEYRFNVKFDGRKITRFVNVYKRFGVDTGKYFIYDRDLINIDRTVDFDGIFTAVLPYWQEDDVMRTLAGYAPINKIKGFRKDLPMDVIIHEESHSTYDEGDYARVLVMKSSSTDPELTYLEACNKLLDYVAPTYTYTVNVLLLENALGFEGTEQVHLGDTVWLKEKVGSMELGLEARVIQTVTSHTAPEDDEVTFTNFKEISTADSAEVEDLRNQINQIQNQQDQINETVVQVTNDITILQQGQEGIIEQLGDVPSVSVGDTPNPNPKEGDIWFLDAVDPETGKTYSTIRIWNEALGDWQDRYSAKDAEEAQAAADEAAKAGADAKAAAEDATKAAQDATAAGQAALDKANQAATDAAAAKDQADAIKVDVDGLQTSVANAQADATKALGDVADALAEIGQVDGKVTDIKTTVDGLTVTVGEVKTTADSALSKATQVSTTVDGLKVTVGEVKTTADGAMTKATQVETTVNGLKTTVSEVKTTADSALSKATTVEQTANGLKTTVSEVQTDLSNLQMGGRNLLTNSGIADRTVFSSNDSSKYPITKTNMTEGSRNFVRVRRANPTTNPTVLSLFSTISWNMLSEDIKGSEQIVVSFKARSQVDSKWSCMAATYNPNANLPNRKDLEIGTEWKQFSIVFDSIPADSSGLRFNPQQVIMDSSINLTDFYLDVCEYKVEKGNRATDWSPAPEDMATASQITQLADQINFKVDKNGVIAQINVSSEGILIDGKYVHITGTTTIDNAVIKTAHIADLAVSNAKIANLAVNGAKIADAAITTAKIGDLQVSTAKIANLAVTDAKIGSLSANKITTGTLDAGKISVINLSASSITSGTIQGIAINGVTVTGSTFVNNYDYASNPSGVVDTHGTLTIANGRWYNEFSRDDTKGGTSFTGTAMLNDEAIQFSRKMVSGNSEDSFMQLSALGLTMTFGGRGGTFTYNDLYSMPKAGIPAASGFVPYNSDPNHSSYPSAVRFGRIVQLAGAFKNQNVVPASDQGITMGTAPEWARPTQTVNVIAQGSGMNRYLLQIQPAGAIHISRYGTGGSYTDINAGHWLNIACCFAGKDV